MVFALSLIFIPIEIVSSLTLNLLGILLNKLDTTERNYVSSIILAGKISESALSHQESRLAFRGDRSPSE